MEPERFEAERKASFMAEVDAVIQATPPLRFRGWRKQRVCLRRALRTMLVSVALLLMVSGAVSVAGYADVITDARRDIITTADESLDDIIEVVYERIEFVDSEPTPTPMLTPFEIADGVCRDTQSDGRQRLYDDANDEFAQALYESFGVSRSNARKLVELDHEDRAEREYQKCMESLGFAL